MSSRNAKMYALDCHKLLFIFVCILASVTYSEQARCCKWIESSGQCNEFKKNSVCKKYIKKYNYMSGSCADVCESQQSQGASPPALISKCYKLSKDGKCKQKSGSRKCSKLIRTKNYAPGHCKKNSTSKNSNEEAEKEAIEVVIETALEEIEEKVEEQLEEQKLHSEISEIDEVVESLSAEEDSDSKASIRRSALERHNFHRRKHGVPDLTWSAEIQRNAQEWADRCQFKHGTYEERKGYGENLGLGYSHVNDWIDSMYSEIQDYDYDNPGFSMATGHFTQIIWKDTLRLGCALSQGCKNRLWVCQYDPSGNSGDYVNNVPPLI